MQYTIDYTNKFKKQYKKIIKQGKDLTKLYKTIEKIANKEKLELKFNNHNLINNKMIGSQKVYFMVK